MVVTVTGVDIMTLDTTISAMRFYAAVALRHPTSVRQARAFARAALDTWNLAALTDPVELCVSELATNAVAHGCGNLFGLSLTLTDRLIIEVFDKGSSGPQVARADELDEGGRGLLLVEHCAAEWGWEWLHGTWKRTWCLFEVPVSPANALSPARQACRAGP
jgi:anti-sigma regulatory factor (Ser/Thr protein kinase)